MKTKTITKQQIDIAVNKGAWQNHYLIYNRKSTDEPENQKNSLQYQKAENLAFALKERLPVAAITLPGFCTEGIISEKHSAFKEDELMILSDNGMVQFRIERPKFHKMVQLLNKKLIKGVIFLCWDRASRNDADEAIIKKLIKSDVDIRFTLVSYEKTSSGALHMDIDGMFAQHHSRVTSEKVRLNIRNQREKGIYTGRAPVGYLNTGSMEHKPFDKERASLVRQLFERYATGNISLAVLTQWAVQEGFTMYPMRRRRTKEERQKEDESDEPGSITPSAHLPSRTSIHKILSNPFYAGKIMGNDGVYIQSNSHQPLVKEDLFSKVQKLLDSKNRSTQYVSELFYPYRGFIRCGDCKRVYTPYIKKGIQYYCVNCKAGCSNGNRNLNSTTIDKKITATIERLVLKEEELKEIVGHIDANLPDEELMRKEMLASLERQKRKVQEDINYLQNNKLDLLKTGVYTAEDFIKTEQELKLRSEQLQSQEAAMGISINEAFQKVIKCSELLKNLLLYDFIAKSEEKDQIVRSIFSELTVTENNFRYQCKNGFEILEKRFAPSGALKDWIYELPCLSHCIPESIMTYFQNNSPPE